MNREQAERILGMPTGHYTESQLARAYRVKVRQHHPDLHGAEHETSMRLVNIARDVLREYIGDATLGAVIAPRTVPPPPAEPEPEAPCSVADTGLFRRVQREREAGRAAPEPRP